MTQSDHDLSERLPADVLQRYQEQTRYFDEVAARKGHSSAVVMGRFDALSGQPPTEREIAVLQFVADGLTNKEIAVRLSLSEETIKSYIQRILAKLVARNRAHAVTLGYEQGWIGLSVAEPTLTEEGWAQHALELRHFRLPSSRERANEAAEETTPPVLAPVA
jgi:DNA-binding CsgD family transcriptional regulator